jgi:hypothetical protein
MDMGVKDLLVGWLSSVSIKEVKNRIGEDPLAKATTIALGTIGKARNRSAPLLGKMLKLAPQGKIMRPAGRIRAIGGTL